jgi:hypothetical protein
VLTQHLDSNRTLNPLTRVFVGSCRAKHLAAPGRLVLELRHPQPVRRLSECTRRQHRSQYAGQYGCRSCGQFGNRTMEAVCATACANNPPRSSWALYDGTAGGPGPDSRTGETTRKAGA